MENKLELLKKVSLFSDLNNEALGVIAQYSDYIEFKKDKVIFEEGAIGKGLYIIASGEVVIVKGLGNSDSKELASFIPGESFGEMGLFDDTPRTAAAIAGKDSRLLVFPMGIQFRNVLLRHPGVSARILHRLLAIIAGRIRSTNKLISEKTGWVKDLKRQIYRDKLTGLYNRNFLEENFKNFISINSDALSLLMMKPDNFKDINDTYGHDAGDRTLRLLADNFSSALQEGDFPVRFRGDEFAALLPGRDAASAARLAEKLRALVRDININEITGGERFVITVSIGVAGYSGEYQDGCDLIEKARDMMFEARNKGGDAVLFSGI